MSVMLLAAVLDGGIQNPNFFNGRVLTAHDLRDDQRANLARARRLGQAIGEGVAYGLFVTAGAQSLAVSAGLAINRRGDALLLPKDQPLELLAASASSAAADSPFAPCKPLDPTSAVPDGFYLLAITAATGLSGRAATSSLNGTRAACASQYEVEGVQFKLVALGTSDFAPTNPPTSYRSQLAHACFGTQDLLSSAADPFDAPPRYGLVDALRDKKSLADCDVPLAVLRWSGGAIEFVDVWAVRRPCAGVSALAKWPPPARPAADDEIWSQHASARRRVEGQALLLQFQAQVELLRTQKDFAGLVAAQFFPFLPPAGYLPIDASKEVGLDWLKRFFALPARPTLSTLDPAYLRDYFNRSFFVDAIPVNVGKLVPVDLFTVPGATSLPYVVFLRREQIAVIPTQPPREQPEPAIEDAHLIVAVHGDDGKLLRDNQVERVGVTGMGGTFGGNLYDVTGKAGSLYTRQLIRTIQEAQSASAGGTGDTDDEVKRALRTKTGQIEEDNPFFEDADTRLSRAMPAVYEIGPLPPGNYTVGAVPVRATGLQANSARVTLAAGQTRTLALRLKKASVLGGSPYAIDPKDKWALIGGSIIDKIYFDPRWQKLKRPPPPRPEEIEDWLVEPPSDMRGQIEDRLAEEFAGNPELAVDDPQVYVRPDYKPGEVYEAPYAYVGTRDGSLFPVVLVPSQHALRGDVPATRSGMRDLDSATYNATLRGTGLENLDAVAGAWTALLGQKLGLGERGASSLVGEMRGAAGRLQDSFESYPGVDADASQKLVAAKIADDVALANATPQAVLDALGGEAAGYSEGFVQRLIDRARSIVSPSAWSLEGLALNETERGKLVDAGLESRGALLARAGDEAGRAKLREVLGADDAVLDRLLDQARVGLMTESLRMTLDLGIAQLPGVTATRARRLIEAGFGTTATLANADRAEIASILDISEAEASTLIERAIGERGGVAIDQLPGLDQSQSKALRDRGIHSAGDLARADPRVVSEVLNDQALASRVLDSAGVMSRMIRGQGR